MKFENPSNGYIEEVSDYAPLWVFLFGIFYLAYKGLWSHVLIWISVFLVSLTISTQAMLALGAIMYLAYIIDIKHLLEKKYSRKGWLKIGKTTSSKSKGDPSSDFLVRGKRFSETPRFEATYSIATASDTLKSMHIDESARKLALVKQTDDGLHKITLDEGDVVRAELLHDNKIYMQSYSNSEYESQEKDFIITSDVNGVVSVDVESSSTLIMMLKVYFNGVSSSTYFNFIIDKNSCSDLSDKDVKKLSVNLYYKVASLINESSRVSLEAFPNENHDLTEQDTSQENTELNQKTRLTDELVTLNALHKEGSISDQEFKSAKSKLLEG